MLLQEQSLGMLAIVILMGAVFILGISYNKRLAKRFRSQYARRALDAIGGLTMFVLAMWLILGS